MIAGLIMKGRIEQETLERMFAVYQSFLEDSWVYQEIMQRGMGKGEQRALLTIIQKRFPDIAEAAAQLIGEITDADRLEALVGEVSVAQNAQEVLRILNAR